MYKEKRMLWRSVLLLWYLHLFKVIYLKPGVFGISEAPHFWLARTFCSYKYYNRIWITSQKSEPLTSSVRKTWKIASVHLKLPALKVIGISFGIKGCIFRSKLRLKAENTWRSEEGGKRIYGGTRGETDWIPVSGKIRQRLIFSFFALSTIHISHGNSQPEHILEWRLLHLMLGRASLKKSFTEWQQTSSVRREVAQKGVLSYS